MKISIVGDPICDHHFYRGIRDSPDSPETRGFLARSCEGGALLLYRLVKATLCNYGQCEARYGIDVNHDKLPEHYHAYSLWEPQPSNLLETSPAQQRIVWRSVVPPFGYGRPSASPQSSVTNTPPDLTGSTVIVIDDAGLDFRRQSLPDCDPEWIVLKLSGSIGEGALWASLASKYSEKLVVVVSADQLRQTDCRLNRGLSWEATTQDLLRELDGNPALARLKVAAT